MKTLFFYCILNRLATKIFSISTITITFSAAMNPAQSVGQTEKISQVSQVLSYHVECMVFLQQHKNTPNISSTDELTIFMIL
jgi:hypothetical protein